MATNDIKIIISLKDLASGEIGKIRNGLEQMRGSVGSVTSAAFNLKNALVGLGAGLAIKDVVSTFAGFDDVMRQVGAVANASDQQLAAMTATAQDLGATTRFSAAEAAEGMKFLAMAGFDVEKTMTSLPGVLNLAAAGSIDLGTAADIASNMLSAYNMKAEELPRINDVMVQAFTSSNSTLQELGEAFKYVAPIAAGVGIDLEELVAPMAKLHDAGIKASMAGTSLRGAIDALMNPTKQEAELMDQLGSRMGGAGLQVKDAEGNFVGFSSIIEQLEKAGITATESLELFGLRAGPGMQALVSQGSAALKEMEEKLRNSGGRADEVAAKMEAGIGGAIRSLASAWEGFKIALGGGLEGAATEALKYFTERIRAVIETVKRLKADGTLDEWASKIGGAITKTAGYLESMAAMMWGLVNGPLKPLVDAFISWAPEMIALTTGLLGFQKVLGVASIAMTGLNAAMGMGQWVAYLKHVQSASTYTNLLSVATASLGNALTIAAASVGAFFAGWQIGKIISASDAFGLLPVTIGESVQIGFGMLDEFLSQTKIKFLELRKAWNDLTGDSEESASIDAMIAAEQEHINTIHQTVAAIGEKTTAAQTGAQAVVQATQQATAAEAAANQQKVAAAMTAEQQIQNIQRQNVDGYLSGLKAQTEAAKSEYQRRYAEIEMAEATSQVTHNEAVQAKLAADLQYYEATVGAAKDAETQAAEAYGVGSAKHAEVLEKKKAALDGYLAKEKSIADQIKSLNDQVAESRKSSEDKIRDLQRKNMDDYGKYQDKVAEINEKIAEAGKLAATDTEASMKLYQEAQSLAAGVADEVKKGEEVVVSQQTAVNTAIGLIEKAQSGMESAAASRKSTLESALQQTQDSAKAAETDLQGVQKSMDELGISVISIEADGTRAVTEIGSVQQALDAIKDTRVVVDADTDLADTKISATLARLEELASKANETMETVVEIKGKASPVAPFSQTMETVSGLMSDFQKLAGEGAENVVTFSGDTGAGAQPFTSATEGIISEYEAVKDKFHSDKIAGRVTFEGEMENFFATADMAKTAMTQLQMDVSAGAVSLDQTFSGAIGAMGAAVKSFGDQTTATAGGVNVDFGLIGQSAGQFGQQIQAALKTGGTEAFDAIQAGLQNYGTEFIAQMNAQIEASKNMADEVVANGEAMIQSLSQQIAAYDQKIASIDQEMLSVAANTQETLRQLNQNLMTDHEKWLDDKARADELYAQAKAELEAGNFEESKKLMLQSQQMASSLAREVKDENGNIIVSIEEATTTAMGMVEQAGAGAQDALAGQKEALIAQQEQAKAQLAAIEEVVSSVKQMSTDMGAQMSQLSTSMESNMTQAMTQIGESIKSAITEAMSEVGKAADGARAKVEEPMTPTINKGPIISALQEISNEAAKNMVKWQEMFKQSAAGNQPMGYAGSTLSKAGERRAYEQMMKERRKMLAAQSKINTYTESENRTKFTGEGSTVKPLSEKIAEMGGKLQTWQDQASTSVDKKLRFTGEGGESLSEAADRAAMTLKERIASDPYTLEFQRRIQDAGYNPFANSRGSHTGEFEGATTGLNLPAGQAQVKDLGKVGLQVGGSEFPVFGDAGVLAQLKEALRRERLTA